MCCYGVIQIHIMWLQAVKQKPQVGVVVLNIVCIQLWHLCRTDLHAGDTLFHYCSS